VWVAVIDEDLNIIGNVKYEGLRRIGNEYIA
jgi:hypothetical protein